MEEKKYDIVSIIIDTVYYIDGSEICCVWTSYDNRFDCFCYGTFLVPDMKKGRTQNESIPFSFRIFSILHCGGYMEENLDKAVKNGEKSAILAVLLWVCAIIGAFVLKCVVQFMKWVFQK